MSFVGVVVGGLAYAAGASIATAAAVGIGTKVVYDASRVMDGLDQQQTVAGDQTTAVNNAGNTVTDTTDNTQSLIDAAVSDLQKQMNDLTNLNTSLSGQLTGLKDNNTLLNTQLTGLTGQLTDLKSNNSLLTGQLGDLSKNYSAVNDLAAGLAASNNALSASLEAERGENRRLAELDRRNQLTQSQQALGANKARTPVATALLNQAINASSKGTASTMLTGPGGVDQSMLTLGKQTLLGL